MPVRTVTLELPEQLYNRLKTQAQAATRSVDEIVLQTLTRSLPPPVEKDLPAVLRSELEAMERLSDEALWQIAQGTMNRDKVALYDVLLERLQDSHLTPEGREWLTRLRKEAEALTLRKAHAFALLQSRGHELPQFFTQPTQKNKK